MAQRRNMDSEQRREARLSRRRERERQRRASETAEERETRLSKRRVLVRDRARRASQSTIQRERDLRQRRQQGLRMRVKSEVGSPHNACISTSISFELIDYAILHEIIIVCLPAHSSHLLQPLDVAVFKSFKVFFSSAYRSFLHNNPGKVITIYNISQLVGEAWPKSLTPENLISGFRHSGIYPLCRAKITPEKLAPSTSTKKKSQKSIDETLAPSDTSKDEISTKKKEEFVREMKEKELEKAAAEQQRNAKREE